MVEAFSMLSHCFKDGIRTDDICFNEWPRVTERIVVMAFGGKMHNNVSITNQLVHQLGVANIACHKFNLLKN
jgi:hypothetical protein